MAANALWEELPDSSISVVKVIILRNCKGCQKYRLDQKKLSAVAESVKVVLIEGDRSELNKVAPWIDWKGHTVLSSRQRGVGFFVEYGPACITIHRSGRVVAVEEIVEEERR